LLVFFARSFCSFFLFVFVCSLFLLWALEFGGRCQRICQMTL
jgi:hypothetical protein